MPLITPLFRRRALRGTLIATAIGGSAILTGCGSSSSSDNTSDMRTYEVQVHNITANQPLSPVAFVIHQPEYQAWVDGQTASPALEILAEGGDNSDLLTEAQNHNAHIHSLSGSGVIGPGNYESVQFEIDTSNDIYLTAVTMLVNTNDAYTGVNSAAITDLATGEKMTFRTPVWDAGTESNSESAGSIPGPADGGEGYNASRSDSNNRVRFHSGVISNQDGLSESILTADHRFDNPAATITITRIE